MNAPSSAESQQRPPTDSAAGGGSGSSAPRIEQPTSLQRTIGLALALVSGLGVALQARINGELGARLGDGMLAAVISFGGGMLLLILMLGLMPRARAGFRRMATALREGSLKPWHILGGVGGGALVATQGLTVGSLGVALFTVGVVAGQTASGLLVDRLGLGPAGPQAPTWNRVLGVLLTIAAVGGALSGGIPRSVAIWLLVLPIIAGFGIAVQQAVNGRVRAAANNTITATFMNFAIGTTALVVFWLAGLPFHGLPTALPSDWWLYVGGAIGICFIAMAAYVVRWTGVLLLGLSTIAGQLIGAVLLDVIAPAHGEHLRTATLVGVVVTLIAIAITALPLRRRVAA